MQVRIEVINSEGNLDIEERVDIRPMKGLTAWMVALAIKGLVASFARK
ncbi:hypothetical protein KEN51_CDS0339 [Pseudomonas phage vB_Pae10145-KEN51]|uniref:Uncharacterized protein n=4 Tax=Viruses TaxID=10239 RepID=A0AAE7S8W4_9CAUD|nr:hypothetical protein FDJ06_gp277 [Pseudomonas phage SL2]ANM44859.1 hypothetical protein KTN4_101 [Pseudomonas phage KTN4]MBG7006452.1 hypothetical protein [Pseudomonas aeruginosa]QGK90093.1 hypothetical protein [Pseudomonas phage vB_PA32_GUMS]QOV07950.1 hypothetical protein [Pseudomonas phage vB_PaeM_kmuB]QXN68621.1 hypothetical protein [Pseudomonas phage PA7]UNI71782.1 baseplate hub protein [Pseudomonas phage Churi01]UXD83078.1 hypothetical protein NP274_00026 [Pseudomonas phage Koomba b